MSRLALFLAAVAALTLGGAATAHAQDLVVNDVTQTENNAGTTSFTFTIALTAPAGAGGVTFDVATANGTALAGTDYTAKSLTGQTIPAGSSTYAFNVLVNGDTTAEPDETFFVNVSNVTGASVADGQGLGTILNDDVPPSADVDVDLSVAPSAPRAGQTFSLSQAVTNAGPDPAAAAQLTTTLPAGTTFQSLSAPGGWSCTTPAVGATGTVTCTNASYGVGTATFTLTLAVAAGTAGGTTISTTSTVSASTPDPDTSDDQDTATVTVAPTSDLGLTLTGPASVQTGTTATVTAAVASAGPDPAAGAQLDLVVPAGAGFVALAAPGGWSCTTPAVGAAGTVTCTRASAPVGTATFTLTETAGPAGTPLVTSGSVAATSFDADAANDDDTVTTAVTAPPVVPEPEIQKPPPAVVAIAPPAPLPPAPVAFACRRIPTLTGRTVAGAREILARDGCRVTLVSTRKGRARTGFRRIRIVAQSLRPGTPVAAPGTTLTVTRGPIRDPRR